MTLVRGTRLLVGDEAEKMEWVLSDLAYQARLGDFRRVMLPSLCFTEEYKDKLNQDLRMYTFPDLKGRDLCLRPEGTNTLANMTWPSNTKLYYSEKCWRYDKPQAGRYREFTQFGCEWLNVTADSAERCTDMMLTLSLVMLEHHAPDVEWEVNRNVSRGASYYKEGLGFEINNPLLGAQKQVVGGGTYDGGVGFAIGVDRLLLSMEEKENKQ